MSGDNMEGMTEEEMLAMFGELGVDDPGEESKAAPEPETPAQAVESAAEAVSQIPQEEAPLVEEVKQEAKQESKTAKEIPNTDEVAKKMEELKRQREAMTADLGGSSETDALDLKKPTTTNNLVQADLDERQGDIKAATLGKLMGLATANEVRLMEGKIDLLSTRVNAMIMKLEKVSTILSEIPTSSDLDRIDVQVASMRSLLKEFIDGTLQKALDDERRKLEQKMSEKSAEQKRTGAQIMSNNND